jgi:SAM-dependent methyltransferase
MANEFPSIWFDTFLSPENAAPVHRELDFVRAYFPLPAFRRLLDVPCGIGRHAGPLSDLGYEMVGIDRSETALEVARRAYPTVEFRALDMLRVRELGEARFDGALCLWQSFGFGDSAENLRLLADVRRVLRPGGRLLMDVYNADAVSRLPAESTEERSGRHVRTRRTRSAGRLRVEIEYSGSDVRDVHDWEIYGPADFEQIANRAGLEVLLSCAWFDATVPPSADHLRMQWLLERGA